jgi:hypothetical protein
MTAHIHTRNGVLREVHCVALRMPAELHAELKQVATAHERDVTHEIITAIRKHVAKSQEEGRK